MKTTLITASVALLICTSCFTTKVTHYQAMDRAVIGKSKDNIIKTFGFPDDKKVEGNYEEWLYNKGQKTVTSNASTFSNANVSVNQYGGTTYANGNSVTHGGGSVSRTYTNYIKIVFQDDRAIKWDTQGVDYAEYKPSVGKTLLGAGVFVGAILIVLKLTDPAPEY